MADEKTDLKHELDVLMEAIVGEEEEEEQNDVRSDDVCYS